MAISKLTIDLKWENDNSFGMTSKEGDEEKKTVIRMDENTHLPALWADVTKICYNYLHKVLEQIGNKMKQ